MKIVTKLMLGVLIIIIIAASIGLFSIVQMKKNSTADTFLYEKSTLTLGFIIKMEVAL